MSRPARRVALLAVLLAGFAAAAAAQEVPLRRLSCGGYDVVPSGLAEDGRATRLSIQKGGRLLESVSDWRIISAACDDITADRVPELVVRTSSGGAHCCEVVRIYTLGDRPRRLLLYEGNNAAGVEVRDLDGDGRRELVLGDDSFAYFDDLCYACSPAVLPLVACYANDGFRDCTRDFPALLRRERDRFLAAIPRPHDEDSLKEAEGRALGVLALSELLGEEQQGLEAVRKAALDEKVMAWLTRALPQVREWVTARTQKLKQ